MLKPLRSRAATSKPNMRSGLVSTMFFLTKQEKRLEIGLILLNDVGKILPSAREPPIPKDKSDQRKGSEVRKA